MPPERKHAAVVGVPPIRDAAIGAAVGCGEFCHFLKPADVNVGHLHDQGAAVQCRQQEDFGHQPVVGGGDFEIDAVGKDLFRKLVGEDFPAPLLPFSGRVRIAEEKADDDKPGGIGDQMIAVDVGPFQMPCGEISV